MWTTEIPLKLIEDLHSMPCLWDPLSSAYKDRNKESDVVASLAVKYSVTVKELGKKLHTLKGYELLGNPEHVRQTCKRISAGKKA